MNFTEINLQELGIAQWGYTEADRPITWKHYEDWVDNNGHGPLGYLADHRKDLRESLKKYYPDFESALVFIFPYFDDKKRIEDFYASKESNGLKIASYLFAYHGIDYHYAIRDRLNVVKKGIEKQHPGIETKLSLDTQPILERDLAFRAGLGWFGKNSMFISKQWGSFFMIGALLFNKKLDLPTLNIDEDHCGQCQACITDCPTLAISPNSRTIEAAKCISTYTIELFKDAPAPLGMEKGDGEIFGCDICQDVCPWNKRIFRQGLIFDKGVETSEKENLLIDFFLRPSKEEILEKLESMSNRAYTKMFKGTPVERTGRVGMIKNIKFWTSSNL
ncbi:MAG: DUF1730 domain-containing protein [Oligoflexia bacterium]|nr:DUF1730 domain-containing protein [Oligoflexia bacterium]